MKKHLLLATALGLALAAHAMADTKPAPGETLAENQTYTFWLLDSLKTMDPQLISSVEDADFARGLFEGMYNEDGDGNLVPAGALSYDLSDDKMTYTFHLRPEAKWSNGDPVVAADYVAGWQRLVDPALASEYAYYMELMQVKNATEITAGTAKPEDLGIKAIDDLTLEVQLTAPIPYFPKMLSNTSTYPVPRATVAKFGADWTKPENIVTNGAYNLKEVVDGVKYVETKSDTYWDAANTIMTEVTGVVVNDENAALTRYESGELDRSTIPTGQFKRLQDQFGAEVHNAPSACSYNYIINLADGKGVDALKDVRVRQALSLALDRDVIVNSVLGMGQIPAYSWTPAAMNGFVMPEMAAAAMTQEERNAKAKELMAEAGYGPDKPLEFTLNYNTSEGHAKIAAAIQQMWKDTLGVAMTPQNFEWKVHSDKLISGDFDMARYAWCADYNEASTFLDLYTSYSTNNDGKYVNADYDKLMKDAKTMADPNPNYAAAEQILATDMPIIPIYHYVSAYLLRSDIIGIPQHNVLNTWYAKDLYRIKQ